MQQFFYQSGDERIHYFFNQLSREQRQSFELYLEYATEQAPFDELQKWMELIQQSEKPENWVERLKRQEKKRIPPAADASLLMKKTAAENSS